MEINIEQIGTIVSTSSTVLLATWRLLKNLNKKISERIAAETKFLAIQLQEIHEQQKFLSERQDSIYRSIMEIKGLENNNRIALTEFERSIKFSLDQNTEMLQELKKSKSEWISENLIKIKGGK